MTLDIDDRPAIAPMYRMQFEAAQRCWVMLYPEGMVRLNGPAGDILRRCDGRCSVREILDELERDYPDAELLADVCDFLAGARARGWIL